MALSEANRDEIKMMVLIELENMFTGITNRYNSAENREMMLYLLDIENSIKQTLVEFRGAEPVLAD